jgi:hypothetical protein
MNSILSLIAFALLAAACHDALPTGAAPPPPPPPARLQPPPEVAGIPTATLRVVRFTSLGSDLQLIVAETGGVSGATFGSPVLVMADGNTDTGCPGLNRVPAGGQWSMDSMGYCAPTGDGTDAISVVIDYQDDAGRRGTFTATMVSR